MNRGLWFLVGLALGLTVPAGADVALKCAPQIEPSWSQACAHDNALQSYFNHRGHIPNRCKIS